MLIRLNPLTAISAQSNYNESQYKISGGYTTYKRMYFPPQQLSK